MGWHRCARWTRRGLNCPFQVFNDEDQDDPEPEPARQEKKPPPKVDTAKAAVQVPITTPIKQPAMAIPPGLIPVLQKDLNDAIAKAAPVKKKDRTDEGQRPPRPPTVPSTTPIHTPVGLENVARDLGAVLQPVVSRPRGRRAQARAKAYAEKSGVTASPDQILQVVADASGGDRDSLWGIAAATAAVSAMAHLASRGVPFQTSEAKFADRVSQGFRTGQFKSPGAGLRARRPGGSFFVADRFRGSLKRKIRGFTKPKGNTTGFWYSPGDR